MLRIDKIQDSPFFAALDESNGAGIILGPDWKDPRWSGFLGAMKTRAWSPLENGMGSWLNVSPWSSKERAVGLYKVTKFNGESPMGQRAYDEALSALLRIYVRD